MALVLAPVPFFSGAPLQQAFFCFLALPPRAPALEALAGAEPSMCCTLNPLNPRGPARPLIYRPIRCSAVQARWRAPRRRSGCTSGPPSPRAWWPRGRAPSWRAQSRREEGSSNAAAAPAARAQLAWRLCGGFRTGCVEDGPRHCTLPGKVLGLHSCMCSPEVLHVRPPMQFDITISGRGGHAAMPHLTADPIVAAAAVVSALQVSGARAHSEQCASLCRLKRAEQGKAAACAMVLQHACPASPSP